ncbi:MAG TPA: hypothetical protein VNH84_10110 [Candidatus Saccharimonadales bacterium]|nr:hypothetical protein [Candidatus Saccharimonadales bacterium]
MTKEASTRTALVPVDADALGGVGAFLAERFHPGPDDHFASNEYLRWQYLEWPEGPGPRAYNCVAGGRILAHAGTVHTRFLQPGKSWQDSPVASNIHSWSSTPNAGPVGAMLLLQSYRTSEVQYAFSFSPQAEGVFKSSGFALRQVIPMYRRVLNLARWNQAYFGDPLPKRMAFRLQEIALAARRVFLPTLVPIDLERVEKFDEKAGAIALSAARDSVLTDRPPHFLNHLLRHPFGETAGYYLREGGNCVGLALVHFYPRHGLRQARVLDCLLGPTHDARLCARALVALEREMRAHEVDVVSGTAGTPWLQAGYLRAGYVRRGRRPLLLRDPKGRVSPGIPVHMALLDSDLAFIG